MKDCYLVTLLDKTAQKVLTARAMGVLSTVVDIDHHENVIKLGGKVVGTFVNLPLVEGPNER